MTAGIKERVKPCRRGACQRHCRGKPGLSAGICLEPAALGGLIEVFAAERIDRRQTAFGRCKHDLCPGLEEGIVRRGQLFVPEPGLAIRVAEPAMRGENDQNFHNGLP